MTQQEATTRPSELEVRLLSLVREHLIEPDVPLDVDSDLPDAGVDSLAIMQLLLLIEEHFGLWLPEAEVRRENLATIRTLAGTIERVRAGEDVA